ncbi:MAG TPA: four helix bundle protein [Candidatus Saccharimonadales bacterium]|nr:four helix bundle protein [Candidatus Saccharimonadales bacterium]
MNTLDADANKKFRFREFPVYRDNTAHTSLNEVAACLDLAFDAAYISTEEHQRWLTEAAFIANQLTAFRKKLVNAPHK